VRLGAWRVPHGGAGATIKNSMAFAHDEEIFVIIIFSMSRFEKLLF
jgi:hypothetical protein